MKHWILIGLFLLPMATHASDVSLSLVDYGNDTVAVQLSSSAPINAIQGTIPLPPELSATGIVDSGSPISFWIQRPEIANGHIGFAGVMPSGWQGTGVLFTFVVPQHQKVQLHLEDARAFLHGPNGQEVLVATHGIELSPSISVVVDIALILVLIVLGFLVLAWYVWHHVHVKWV